MDLALQELAKVTDEDTDMDIGVEGVGLDRPLHDASNAAPARGGVSNGEGSSREGRMVVATGSAGTQDQAANGAVAAAAVGADSEATAGGENIAAPKGHPTRNRQASHTLPSEGPGKPVAKSKGKKPTKSKGKARAIDKTQVPDHDITDEL